MDITPMLSRPTVRGFEARAGLESFAHHLCKALGLSQVEVVWTPSLTTAAINERGSLLLADIGDASTLTRHDLGKYAGFVVHELLHRKWTDFKAKDRRPYVDALHNALEDAWIERKAIDTRLTGNVRALLHSLLRGLMATVPDSLDWADPAQYPFSLAVYCRGYGLNVPVPGALMPVWKEAFRRIDTCQSSHDTLALAQWVFDQINAAADNPQQPQPGQDDGQDDSQDDSQGDDQGDDQDGQDAGEDGQGGQDGQDGQDAGEEGQQEGASNAPGSSESDDQEPGKGEVASQPSDAPDAGQVRHAKPGGDAMEVEPSISPMDAPGGVYNSGMVCTSGIPLRHTKWSENKAPVPGALRYQVRRMFENTAREWKDGGFKSGTLHRTSLHKVAAGSAEVFARRFSEEGIDSAVTIMLDISGSMLTGGLMETAVGAVSVLLDTLAQAGVQTMVIAFGQNSYVVKPFNMPWRKALQALERIGVEQATNDYEAARFATEALMAHPAQRKVILAVTDGDGNVAKTQRQMSAARQLGIGVIGIGIRHDVRKVYGRRSIQIDNVADLGKVAFDKLAA